MDMSICQICKEPIWGFICPDCLASDIKAWLPKKLSIAFSTFNKDFVKHFNHDFFGATKLPCLNCNQPKISHICTFCYIQEVVEWLNGKNSDLAKRLMKMMSITGPSEGFHPVTEFKTEGTDEGVCEFCGLFSNELVLKDGKWVCKECEEFET